MLKLFYVIFMNLHRAPYMIPRMRAEADHPQRYTCLLYTSPSPRDGLLSRMPSSA